MFKRLILAAIALMAATPALAQNDNEPMLGRGGDWEDAAPAATPSRAVVFTALGTYSDLAQLRLIDVRSDAGDQGVLRVTCNGGDTVSGVFALGGSAAAGDGGRRPKPVQAGAGSALASGKTFKGRWGAAATGPAKPVTIGASEPDVCAGIG